MITGVDIGGTKIEMVAFSDDFVAIDRQRVATPTDDYDRFVEAIAGLVEAADARFGFSKGVGLGIPGIVDKDQRSLSANIPCASGRTVARDVARRLSRPVVAENDCRCFALSEATGGAGAGHHVVFGAIIGTGAAGGLVIGGKLERGRHGVAGEYGHLQLPAALRDAHDLPLWRCGCGLPACFESYIAGPGLIALGRHFGVDASSPAALAQAWRAGDSAAIHTRNCFLDILGASFANIVMMCDPDIIVLGGGISLLDEVVEGLPGATARHLFPGFPPPPIARAAFGDSSGVRGAALLASEGRCE